MPSFIRATASAFLFAAPMLVAQEPAPQSAPAPTTAAEAPTRDTSFIDASGTAPVTRVVPVPNTLVQIEPRWRGFLYFVYEDEVVIVNPHDMKIVAVVPA